ncbi:DNA repair protein rhp16, putative [Hepatocystis sp. ex Piliocolobus tephrosceles]|nr:DNA repair protein rhp16, putative [Hepatocystis sp. ex Piliocolobus tephrosceles]
MGNNNKNKNYYFKKPLYKEIITSNCIFIKNSYEWVESYIEKNVELKQIFPKVFIYNNTSKYNIKCSACGLNIVTNTLTVIYPKKKESHNGIVYNTHWAHLECRKNLLHNILYKENHKSYLKDYLKNVNEETHEHLNKNYAEYIYKNLNRNFFFGGYDKLNKHEKRKINNIIKPDTDNVRKENSTIINIENRINENFIIPEGLKCDLLAYQKKGIAWMIQQEKSKVKGGILADEMGMGKTIQALTMILYYKQVQSNDIKKNYHNHVLNDTSSSTKLISNNNHVGKEGCVADKTNAKRIGKTLVITPLPVIMHWCNEIEKFIAPSAISKYIFHGDSKYISYEHLLKHDIVITSYNTLEMEYRDIKKKEKIRCGSCGKLFLPNTLKDHQIYYCSATYIKKKKRRTTTTTNKDDNDDNYISVQDNLNSGEQEKTRNKAGYYSKVNLDNIIWDRIILDDGHRIKNNNSAIHRVSRRLHCSRTKWCLTGTPIQNKLEELLSLLQFIEFYPYAYHICTEKGCKCSQLDFKTTNGVNCDICKHEKIKHSNYFVESIAKPIKKFKDEEERVTSMSNLKKEILDKVLLRRTKEETKEELKLEELIIKTITCELSEAEQYFYYTLSNKILAKYKINIKSSETNNNALFSNLILRLRQAVNHPFLILLGNSFKINEYGRCIKRKNITKSICENSSVCDICLKNVSTNDNVTTRCNHSFHKSCMEQYIKNFDMKNRECINIDKDNTKGTINYETISKTNTYDLTNINNIQNIFDKNKIVSRNDIIFGNDVDNRDDDDVILLNENIINQTNSTGKKINKKRKSISEVKFKNKENSEFISLLSNDIHVNSYPIGCPECYVPLPSNFTDLQDNFTNGNSSIFWGNDRRKKLNSNIINRMNTEKYFSSTKIEEIYKEVQFIISSTDDKILIFSQFIAMLELIEFHLKTNNIICAKFLGTMTLDSRNNILYTFKKDQTLRVLLISLQSGANGLNLQVANRILIVEPCWNPAIEIQAIQRSLRIGQKKKIYITYFNVQNTIEEKILDCQQKKKEIINYVMDNGYISSEKILENNYNFFFK